MGTWRYVTRNTKYIIFVLVLLTTYHLSLITSAYAQSSTPLGTGQTSTSSALSYSVPSTLTPLPSYIPPTSPIYTDLFVNNLFHSFSCLTVGQSIIGQPCLTYQRIEDARGMIQTVPVLSSANLSGGALGATTSLIGALFANPPVKTTDYLASVGQNLGIVKEVHAQVVGSGAQVLNPILTLWQVSRNISYVLMIIIFLIIGLMVMFRNRINPQTVITAQAALPGLVIGLIMITFSYFFAGLISDMAFVGTNVVGYYFSAVRGQADNPQDLVENVQDQSILSIFTPFTRIMTAPRVSSALRSIWDDLADPTIDPIDPISLDPQRALRYLTTMLATQFLLPFGGMFGGPGQVVMGAIAVGSTQAFPLDIAAFSLSFIAILILIYAMFRLLLRLVNSYLNIIFLTFTAPFQFLAAALPGRQGIATGWIQNMLANVLAFPAVLAVLYFVAFILGPNNFSCSVDPCPFILSNSSQKQDNTFITTVYADPPEPAKPVAIVDNSTFPLFGGLDLDFIRIILAFGALVALPAIPDVIARTIGKVSQAGQLIGQELGGNVGQGQKYAGQFQSGTSGLAGQFGRVSDEPGLIYDPGEAKWRPPATAEEVRLSGARAGQWTRFKRRIGY